MEIFGVELALTVSVLLMCFMMLIRNNLGFKYRTRAIDVAYANALMAIKNGVSSKDCYKEFHRLTYNQMLFDLTKWKYSHFYPDS